ncbi:MAG: M24 family metallopeptidase [Cuniculiplasma sp.]
MFRVSQKELKRRMEKIGNLMNEKTLSGVYITGTTSFKYLADYFYIPTERPAAFLIDKDCKIHFFGPLMEKEHILSQCPNVEDSYGYPDYPGEKHPLKFFGQWIQQIMGRGRLGVDNPSFYGSSWGFRPIPTGEIVGDMEIVNISEDLYNMRKIKSGEEIELMRESSKWGNLAHNLLQKYTEPGKFDFEISARASSEANMIAMNAFGKNAVPPINYPIEIGAGFRGQVGEHSYYPHSLSNNREIRKGDMLGSGASGEIDGYHIEIERNMFVGKPTDTMRKYHELAVKMQEIAIGELEVGKSFGDIDRKVIKFAEENNVLQFRLHHSGHCIGLEGHEAPFLDVGETEKIQENMTFSVEPGIYVRGLGGFRHSDTVVMHADGPEVITYYPRDTDSLTIGP